MRLNTLEIKGFKSFADKTTIHFNKDITGVVGPNGCGKSNIVDAIRWVLGETKSSNLRTERMENLVFNGTKKRKSSGLAEVALTFDNTRNLLPTDYNTVTISRHYYRTGESEYRLNDVPCRLKDIRTLFMDTGISSDSYAIIELNMLSDLLNDKDNSRRRLFEQAAGISKYKIRKRETLNKLKGTQTDLDRVQDLLFEIENNMRELERQARKARRHAKLKDKYRSYSIEWAVQLLGEQKSTYTEISAQQESEEDMRIKLEEEVQRMETELESKKEVAAEQEAGLNELQKNFNQQLEELRKQENTRNLLSERIKFLSERKENLKTEIAVAEDNLVVFEKERQQLDKQRAAEEEAITHIQEQLEQLNGDLKKVKSIHNDARERLESRQAEWKKLENQMVSEEKDHDINVVRIENFERDIERITQDDESREAQFESRKQEAAELDTQLTEASTTLQHLEENEQQLDEAIVTNRSESEGLKQELAEVRRKLDARQNEFRLTKNMLESLEGFPESVRYLRKQVESTKKAPLLSDIISTDEQWKAAVESYLEPWLNHYVVPDLPAAMSAIDQLNAKQKGRASFLILSEVKELPVDLPALPEGIQSALSVVETDSQYKALVENLLSRAVIIETADVANHHNFLLENNLDGIAHSGKYVRSGFAISGGSVGLFKGKRLGRARNLEKLEKEIQALQGEESSMKERLEQNHAKLEELQSQSAKQKIREKSRLVQEFTARLHACNSRVEEIETQREKAASRKAALQTDIETLRVKNETLAANLLTLKETHAKLGAEVTSLDEEFKALSNQLSVASNNYNQQNIRFHQQKHSAESLSQALGFKARQLEETLEQKTKNQQLLDSSEVEEAELSGKLEGISAELELAYTGRDEAQEVINEAAEDFNQLRKMITKLEEELRKLQKNREEVGNVILSIKDRMNELKLQLTSIKERLMIEFGIDIDDVIDQEPSMEMGREELEMEVEKMKRKLDNYGEINPMAVQAYDEMKARYDFINGQKEDLEEAKNKLLATIAEIDETARDKFMDAYEKVRVNFVEVFKTLFRPDDNCDLVLVDPENPLESKINVMAQPKGKRPTVIDQLSGGEKTLTAMALLFSLYLLKPAPFCVLDEVDAPLDDANINKYNDMIRKFSDKSQFIIVTHNKRTMAKVDSIYGVTMQEEGISKVVPVDFQQWAEAS